MAHDRAGRQQPGGARPCYPRRLKTPPGRWSPLAARLALLLLTAAALVSCTTPPPDPHGIPANALELPLGSQVREELICAKKNDCTDWWRTHVPDPGELRLVVDAAAARGDRPTYTLALADDRAQVIEEVHSYGRVKLEQSWHVEPGYYFVRLHSGKESRGPEMNYWMRAELVRPRKVERERQFSPPPRPVRPPEPVYRTVHSSLLELEPGPGGGQYILIGSGSDQGVRSGQRGKLMDGSNAVADFEVVDVYPDGSRARLEGHPSGPITPKLAVEVYVPESRSRRDGSPW